MFRFTRGVPVLVLSLGLAVATSCAKKSEETAPPPASTSTGVVSVVDVELGRSVGGDKRVTEKVDQFKPNDVIYASVLTTGASSNAVLKARWTYADGQLVEESEQSIAPAGDAATEFHISKPDGWPAGKYRVEVSLDGAPTASKEFEVK